MKDKRIWIAVAALWGFAEATFFFVVPDILLTSAVLLFGIAAALRFAAITAVAAAAGGFIMMRWGAVNPEAAHAFLLTIPLIEADLLARVETEIAGAWPVNLTIGAMTGAPYKIYAVEAGAVLLNPALFVFASIAARFARFALVISLATAGFAIARRFGFARLMAPGLAAAWVAIYVIYISLRINAG